MKLNKLFLIFCTIAFLTQTLPKSVFAAEEKTDLILKSKLKKENLLLTRTLSDLKSETAKPDDKVALKTLDDIDNGNKIIIPCGSTLEGKVIKARRSLIFRSDAYIDCLITSIKTASGCNICIEQEPLKLRIVDPHYKSFIKRTAQRAPVIVAGSATSITLAAATNLSGGVIFAIVTGAQFVSGFISGIIDPDIDKTRLNGGIVRGVEGTALGTFLITVERGYDIDSATCCYITINLDNKTKEQINCSIQKAIASNKNY